MTKSAFQKVYYKFTFTIRVIEDAVSSFSDIALKLLECTTCLQHRFPISKNTWWRNQFYSLCSFAPCYLKYFYFLVNPEGFYLF